MKKITLIAPYAFGYPNYLYEALKKQRDITVQIIYLDVPAFAYKNVLHRIQNMCYKTFLNKNLKKIYVEKRVKKEVLANGLQDTIFIIRPDILDNETLSILKKSTKQFDAYYWDSTRRFSRMVEVKHFFDTLYSYDKQDVDTYGFKLLTNYIFKMNTAIRPMSYQFFNISTADYRLPFLENVTSYIAKKGWTHNILVYNGSPIETEHVTFIEEQKTVKESLALMEHCAVVVEIQREEQTGLSFRVFEALGLQKKLITTNKDIVTYDFYNPNNILVIDVDNLYIPEDFVLQPYIPVSDKVLAKYYLKNWIKPLFLEE